MLISLGHVDVLNYEYSFFKASILAIEKLKKDEIVGMACAVGLAFSGEKEMKKFMRSK